MKKKDKIVLTVEEEHSFPDNAVAARPAIDFHNPEELATHIQQVLRGANRPLRLDELLRVAHLPRKAKKKTENALFRMQDEGRVLRSAGGWSSPARLEHREGILSVQRAGMGFVTPLHGGPDIYIHPAAMNDAWHGDTVEVLLLPGKHGPSREGRVLRVSHRAQTELPVHAVRRQKDGMWLCAPANPRIQALFLVDSGSLSHESSGGPDRGVSEGDLLLVRPGEKSAPHVWLAEATVNLQHEQSPAAQERVTKSEHGIPGPFPAAVLAEIRGLPEDPVAEDFQGRRDLRHLDFVTIDGRTARDFDDAIHVAVLDAGFRLIVAIADVSRYVRLGTALDAEARLRGNSYYFPLSVEPMLPEALSNGLCSLKPDVPRLAMVADMRFSDRGVMERSLFYEAVIRSRARLTYGEIERGLLLHEAEEEKKLEPVLPMLRAAEQLARQLLERRRERGSLDFDVPEAAFLFDSEGELLDIVPRKRHFGHRIIEECMIAANEAVASFLEQKGQPTLYRVHQPPDPDKLASLAGFLAESGLVLAKPSRRGKNLPSARDLQNILAEAAGTPREYTVTRLLLRAMMQARYQPENEGHFGLASRAYCHFTSPIRRYADLVVHRALKAALGLERAASERPLTRARLAAVADHINVTERTAMEAEREIHKRLAALLLQGRVGEAWDGIVSGVTDFGLFVELPSVMAEGMVRLSSLGDDYYDYLPDRQELRGKRTRRSFRLGQKLRVTLIDVNLGRQEITLALEGEPKASGRNPASRRNKEGTQHKKGMGRNRGGKNQHRSRHAFR